MEKIQLFCATYDEEECLKQIKDCLDIGWTGAGYKTVEFEEAWKNYTGLGHAFFTNSATAGLNLAVDTLKELNNWNDDDEIISTPLTFVSTNHAILQAGMHVVFADVDDTLCLNPIDVEKKITDKTKAVMYVGFGGNAGHYEDIVRLCRKYDLKLILDAAHMAGTRVNGVVPGSEADAVIYSFQAVKNLPTGDAGMLCMKDENGDKIARERAWLGINKDTYSRSVNKDGNYKWKYNVEYVGNKYGGNAIMVAIALAQLPRLDKDNAYRRTLAGWYLNGLSGNDEYIGFVKVPENCQTSQHLFQIIVPDRDGLLNYLNTKNIYPGVHYIPNTEYSMYSYAKGTCHYAEYIGEHILSLPMHMRITYEDVQYIVEQIKDYVLEKNHDIKLDNYEG